MGAIVKFVAATLVLSGCGAASAGGALQAGRGHPLLRVHAFPPWESAYVPARRDAPPAPLPRDERPARGTEARSLQLKPGEVPTGVPERLALATTESPLPTDADLDATPTDEALPMAIRSRHASLIDDARALVGKPLEPAAFLGELVETTTVSSAVAERAAQNPVRDLFVRLRRQKKTFEEGTPRAGDLVFFHNTRDLNGDNRNNDWYTSVGVVTRVDDDGTVVFIGPGPRDVQEMRLNLGRPRTRRDEKRQQVLNDYVRPKRLSDPSVTQYLAGELFAGFGRL